MKKIFSILSIGLSAFALPLLTTGCVEEVPEVIETLDLSNLLTPSSTSAVVDASIGTSVTFTWTNSNAAANYHLEVYQFETAGAPASVAEITEEMLTAANRVVDENVEPSESGSSTSYTAVDLDPEMSLYARVCAQSSADPDTKTTGDSKWAVFPYPIDTYSVLPNVKSVTVTERTSNSISVSWTLAEGDDDGVNQVRISPNPEDPTSAYLSIPVDNGVTSATVDGLAASTKYTVAVHFNSANRGQMFVWTTPDWDGVQDAADTAVLKQLLREAGNAPTGEPLRIRLTNTETAYDLDGTADVLGPVEILGQQTTDGKSPVIIGGFEAQPPLETYTYWNSGNSPVTNTVGATYIRLEALELDGDGYATDRPFKLDETFPSENVISVSIVNCDIHAYSAGFFYDGDKVATFDKILIDNNVVSDIQGSGGDGFDIRKATSVTSIDITNNTFNNGMRTFVRIDPGVSLGTLNFANNTVNNLSGVDDGNNKGLFNIRATLTGTFTITKNLFLNLNGCPSRTVMFPAQATAFPTSVSSNFYYNLADTFFYTESGDPSADEFPESAAIAGGGSILSSDPCYNSIRGILNVTSTAVTTAGAGDPRWLSEYVPEEMADLVPVEYGYEWTLNDKSAFGQTVEETSVIENTKFIVSSGIINILDEGMEFSTEASVDYSGVPSDCAIAFMVDGPGSVFASTVRSSSGTANDHISVALGDAEGTSATVAGSVFAGAENQKIVFDGIQPGERHLVYLYACGPIVLTDLEWSDDVNSGSSAIADPSVTADVSVAGTLTLSWDAVPDAGSYIISFGAKESDAEYAEDEYTISTTGTSYTWDAFPSGTYTVNVQAVPAEADKFSNSAIVGTSVTVTAPELTQMTSGSLTQDDFIFLATVVGNKVRWAADKTVTYKNFFFSNTETEKVSFGIDNSFGAYHNGNGAGKPNVDPAASSRTIQFRAAGSGKLEIIAASTSTGKNAQVGYAVNGEKNDSWLSAVLPDKPSAPITEPNASFEVAVEAGDVIDIYSTQNVYIMSVNWEPAGGLPPVAGLTPVTEATTWGSAEWGSFYTQYGTGAGYGKDFTVPDADYYVTNNFMIFAGGDDTKFRVGSDDEYIQLASGSFNSDGQPSEYYRCFLRFRVSGNGKLTLTARATGGTPSAGRYIYVAVGGDADKAGVGTVLEETFEAGQHTSFTEHSWDITANNGDAITIFENQALRVGTITWTPAE